MSDRSDETIHRYPWPRLRGDYIRAAIGFALCLWLLSVAFGNFWPALIITGPTLAFAIFGARTWLRHTTVLTVTADGVAGRPSGVIALPWHSFALPWNGLNRVKLSYYSTRRDKSEGWLQMTIATPTRKWSCDSNVEGFDRLARLAFDAARRNGLALSDTTMTNFNALGIATDDAAGAGWGDPATWRGEHNPRAQ